MAKAVAALALRDPLGRPFMWAYREDGAVFYREYGYNGYGRGWGRWAPPRRSFAHTAPTLDEMKAHKDFFAETAIGLRLPNAGRV